MDPVRPGYRLGGTTTELGEYWLQPDRRWWITDAQVREQLRGQPNRHLLGLAHKQDKGVAQQHGALRRPSLRELVRRHDEGTWLKFLYFNTYLLHAPGFQSKPDREERRHEIGRALAESEYDVAGLTEVFRDPEKDAIRSKFGDRRVQGVNGPAASTLGGSSGLWMLLAGDRVRREDSGRRAFDKQASGLFDEEGLAEKGMLYVEVGIGDGMAVDFFLTHLHAEDPSVRREQLEELTHWIAATHKATNVAVVGGDFNVSFNDDECARLYRHMASLDLFDAWLTHGGLAGATDWQTGDPRSELRSTARTVTRTDWFEPAQEICRFGPGSDGSYCDDYHLPASDAGIRVRDAVPGNRIDYVFVERPMPAHTFTLDLARIRRRHFWRGDLYRKEAHKRRLTYLTGSSGPPAVFETPHYMSDHLGLEVECLACPVMRGPT